MNFVITNSCNKGCEYCFARESRNNIIENKEKIDMDFIQFCEYIAKVPRNKEGYGHIKLLGGEPTQHPELERILEAAKNKKIYITMISNFLFSDDILKILMEYTANGTITGFLINSTDLDKNNRMEIFSYNYNKLYEFLYPTEKEKTLSLGITFSENYDWKYYINYIKFLKENLISIERLRLSLPFPGDMKDKNKFIFINNKDFGFKILSAVKQSIDLGFINSIDCTAYPCMFNNREEWKYVERFVNKIRINCNGGSPMDIFPDGTISYCYPLKESIKLSINKYNNFDEVQKDLMKRYALIMHMVDKPEECKKCEFFTKKACEGPCLGQYNLSDIKIGLNLDDK